MHIIIGTLSVIILIAVVVYFIFSRSRDLGKLLNLEIKLKKPSVNCGENLEYTVISTPTGRIKIDSIDGELVAKRFDDYKGNWTIDSLFSGGEVLTTFIFSFGKDIILVPGTANEFEGYVPIPETAFPTEESNLIHIHWLMTVRAHCRGYKSAAVTREVTVTALHPQMIEAKKREEQQNVEFIPESGKVKGKTNVQILFPGSSGEMSGKESFQKSASSFGFLELENEKDDI